jgi:hypothetical protein
MTDKPVLIGSYALEKHGFNKMELGNESDTDIDIVCKLSTAQQFLWFADKKITPRLFGYSLSGKNKQKDKLFTILDISLYDECSSGKKLLYDKCNELISNSVEINLNKYSPQVLLPPIEWIYALLRGHIHRIPQVTLSQEKNILIWEKYMTKYHAIRSKFGYRKLDDLFQNVNDIPYQIFKSEFDYVTQTIGDAPSLEDKPEETFFNDKVKRYIPHDDLHLQIAMINRGNDAKPLYPQFQVIPDSVEMDKNLFMAATKDDQINTLKEEIMVLYLERKALPNAVEHDRMLDEFDFKNDESLSDDSDDEESYKQTSCKRDFNDIICHFITNLCGSGHSWLRQYCIDHWTLLTNINSYPIEKLCQFVNSFNHAGRISGLHDDPPNRISNLQEFIDYHQKVIELEVSDGRKVERLLTGNIKGKNRKQIFSFALEQEERKEDSWSYYGGGRAKIRANVYSSSSDTWEHYDKSMRNIKVVMTDQTIEEKEEEEEEENEDEFYDIRLLPDQLKTISEVWNKYFTMEKNILFFLSDGIIYNPAKNIAISINPTTIIIYIIEISSDSSYITFGVHLIEIYNLKDNDHVFIPPADAVYDTCNTNFSIDERTSSIYESTCNGGYDRNIELEYLNKYGRTFDELSEPLETLARIVLDFYKDEDEEDHR